MYNTYICAKQSIIDYECRQCTISDAQRNAGILHFIVVAQRVSGFTLFGKNTTQVGQSDTRRRKMQFRFNSQTALLLGTGSDFSGSYTKTITDASLWNVLTAIARGSTDHDIIENGKIQNFTDQGFDSSFNAQFPEIGGAFNNGAETITGDIAELIVYDRALTFGQRQGVENYLYSKYGLFPGTTTSTTTSTSSSTSTTTTSTSSTTTTSTSTTTTFPLGRYSIVDKGGS